MRVLAGLHREKSPRGAAVVTALLVMVVLLLLSLTYLGVSMTESNIATNTANQARAFYAAEAGLESAFVNLRGQLQSGTATTANLNAIAAPTLNSQPGLGLTVGVVQGNPAGTPPFSTTIASGAFRSLNATETDYVITSTGSTSARNTTSVKLTQLVQYLKIPLFQFGVFYGQGVDLEIAPGPQMTFNGRVHSNSNIYVVANSGLQFQSYMTTTGNIYRYVKDDPATRGNNPTIQDASGTYQALNFDHFSNVGFNGPWSANDWKTQAVNTFNGLVLDSAMGVPQITPPVPALFNNPSNPDVVAHELIERGSSSDSAAMQAAKLYYQADLRIVDGVATLKNGSPANFSSCSGTVTTSQTFYDARQGATMTVTQVNVAALRTCSFLSGSGTTLYVSDSGSNKGVRLVNGSQVTSGGLTVVSDNPIYVQGDYNTVNKQPAAVMGDAITVLSNNWSANGSDTLGNQTTNNRPATNTTVNAAFALGPSAESQVGQGNGQLENLIRFLEDWSVNDPNTKQQATITYSGSLVSLWHSQKAQGQWYCCGNKRPYYYNAPVRKWSYDQTFNTTQPPGTPSVVMIVKGAWMKQ